MANQKKPSHVVAEIESGAEWGRLTLEGEGGDLGFISIRGHRVDFERLRDRLTEVIKEGGKVVTAFQPKER